MMHFGRSGSTVLARQLAQHSQIAWLEEVFTLLRQDDPENYDYTPAQMLEIVAGKAADRRRRKPDLFVGYEIKLQNFLHNPSASLIGYVKRAQETGNCLHIILRRRNTLRRIFSVYKAEATRVYHVSAGDSSQAARTYRVDMNNLFDPDTGQHADTLPELLARARAREETVLKNYAAAGIDFLPLVYEDDIETDPRQAYGKVLDYLGLAHEPAEITLNRTGGRHLRDEVTNFDEVEAALDGTEFEWMIR